MKSKNDINYLSMIKKTQNSIRKAQNMERKYKRLSYERLGKHIAKDYQVPKMKRGTKRIKDHDTGKYIIKHPLHKVLNKDKNPEYTKYYTYKQFNSRYSIITNTELEKLKKDKAIVMNSKKNDNK